MYDLVNSGKYLDYINVMTYGMSSSSGNYQNALYYRSGYNSHGSHVIPPIHHHGGGSGGSCACACACACAGGGRAGCSRKDFYDKKLKIEQIKKVFNK